MFAARIVNPAANVSIHHGIIAKVYIPLMQSLKILPAL